jgi:hypothetical protein
MQLILAAIAFVAALKGTEGTTPAAGSPSGYAMRVQGQGDIAVPFKKFSAGSTPNDYPQNSTKGSGDQTWAMWIKAYHPLGGGKVRFTFSQAFSPPLPPSSCSFAPHPRVASLTPIAPPVPRALSLHCPPPPTTENVPPWRG